MENLQVLLCRHLLLSTSCLLIPTETTNTTLIRFCEASWEELEMEFVDIKLIDAGNKITMSTNIKEEKCGKNMQENRFHMPLLKQTNFRA